MIDIPMCDATDAVANVFALCAATTAKTTAGSNKWKMAPGSNASLLVALLKKIDMYIIYICHGRPILNESINQLLSSRPKKSAPKH